MSLKWSIFCWLTNQLIDILLNKTKSYMLTSNTDRYTFCVKVWILHLFSALLNFLLSGRNTGHIISKDWEQKITNLRSLMWSFFITSCKPLRYSIVDIRLHGNLWSASGHSLYTCQYTAIDILCLENESYSSFTFLLLLLIIFFPTIKWKQ